MRFATLYRTTVSLPLVLSACCNCGLLVPGTNSSHSSLHLRAVFVVFVLAISNGQTQSSSSQSSGCSSSTLWHNLVLVVGAAVSSWLERQCSSGKQGNRCLGNAFFNGSHSGESMAWLPKSHGRCISEKTNNSAKMAKHPFWWRSNESSGETALDKHKLIASYQALNV
jgi:hypothetical protein